MNSTGPYWSLVTIGSGNGLVPSGTRPLPEPMLTQIYVAVSLSHNELRPQCVKSCSLWLCFTGEAWSTPMAWTLGEKRATGSWTVGISSDWKDAQEGGTSSGTMGEIRFDEAISTRNQSRRHWQDHGWSTWGDEKYWKEDKEETNDCCLQEVIVYRDSINMYRHYYWQCILFVFCFYFNSMTPVRF